MRDKDNAGGDSDSNKMNSHGGKRDGAGRPKGQGRYGTPTKPIRVPEYLTDDIIKYSLNRGFKIPFYSSSVQAGDPSFADEHIGDLLDMNQHFIKNPSTTFCVKVSGLSMKNVGIFPDDLLIVDNSIEPRDGKIVVAAVDNMLTVKTLSFIDGKPFLMPENPEFKPVEVSEESEVKIWGVVTSVLRSL